MFGIMFPASTIAHLVCLGSCVAVAVALPGSDDARTIVDDGLVLGTLVLEAFCDAAMLRAVRAHRSHPSGSLSSSSPTRRAVASTTNVATTTALAVVLAQTLVVVVCAHASPRDETDVDPPSSSSRWWWSSVAAQVLAGSNAALLLGAVLGFVSDAWYVVGSGEFRMVSLDTMSVLFHFVAPGVVLGCRFLDRYSDAVRAVVARTVETLLSPDLLATVSDREFFLDRYDDLVAATTVLLAVLSFYGVHVLNDVSPLNGYVVSRTYLHGQPNTKRVAFTLRLSDLVAGRRTRTRKTPNNDDKDDDHDLTVKDMGLDEREEALLLGKDDRLRLTVLVGDDDAERRPAIVRELVVAGHETAVWPTSSRSEDLARAFDRVARAAGRRPTWCRTRDARTARAASADLDARVALWSSRIRAARDGRRVCEADRVRLRGEIKDKGGGNVVDLVFDDDDTDATTTTTSMMKVVRDLFEALPAEYAVRPLSDVVRQPKSMDLS